MRVFQLLLAREHGQLMKPKEIHSIIRTSGRIPAQRSTTYRLLQVYSHEGEESDLDKADPQQFGLYSELIKLNKFRYKDGRNCSA